MVMRHLRCSEAKTLLCHRYSVHLLWVYRWISFVIYLISLESGFLHFVNSRRFLKKKNVVELNYRNRNSSAYIQIDAVNQSQSRDFSTIQKKNRIWTIFPQYDKQNKIIPYKISNALKSISKLVDESGWLKALIYLVVKENCALYARLLFRIFLLLE